MLDELNMSDLRRMAQCTSPDSQDSPGGKLLRGVLRDVRDALESGRLDTEDASDVAHEIADARVPVYTHEAWLTFIDLGAYQEDPDGGAWDTSHGDGNREGGLTGGVAKVALYQIGRRLAEALFSLAADAEGDDA